MTDIDYLEGHHQITESAIGAAKLHIKDHNYGMALRALEDACERIDNLDKVRHDEKQRRGMCYIAYDEPVGDCILWWRQDGAGYTIDLSDAGIYDKDSALKLASNREEDIVYPCEYIDGLKEPMVRYDYISPKNALRAAE